MPCSRIAAPTAIPTPATASLASRCLTGPTSCAWLAAPPQPATRMVYVVGHMPEESLIAVTSAVAAGDPDAILLLDTPETRPWSRRFLEAYKPERVFVIGAVAEGLDEGIGIRAD